MLLEALGDEWTWRANDMKHNIYPHSTVLLKVIDSLIKTCAWMKNKEQDKHGDEINEEQ